MRSATPTGSACNSGWPTSTNRSSPTRVAELHEAAHALGQVVEEVAPEGGGVAGPVGEPEPRVLDGDAAHRRHDLDRIAVRHHEADVGVLREERRQVEEEVGRFQEPPVGRPVRVEHPEDALVVRERGRVVDVSPRVDVARERERPTVVVERQLEDPPVLRRAVDRGDVVHRRLDADGPARVVRFGVEVGRRYGILDLPLAQVPEPRVDREQVVRGGGPRSTRAHHDQRPFDRVGRGLDCVVRVPVLDPEAVHQATDDDRLDASSDVGVVADVGSDRGDETLEAFLPAVGTEVGEPGLDLRALEQRAGGRRPWASRYVDLRAGNCLPTCT